MSEDGASAALYALSLEVSSNEGQLSLHAEPANLQSRLTLQCCQADVEAVLTSPPVSFTRSVDGDAERTTHEWLGPTEMRPNQSHVNVT